MNFLQTYKDGEEGKHAGLPTGLKALDASMDRIQKASIYGIAAAPKVGKSTFVDFAFMLNPYLYSIEHDIDVDFIYYSLEMSRTKLEYKAAAFFFMHDHNISQFEIEGITIDGVPFIPMSPRYLLHKLRDDNDNIIKVIPEHKQLLEDIYQNRIIPLFGEYDSHGKKIKKGKVEVIEDRLESNPTGMWNHMRSYAEDNGTYTYEPYTTIIKDKSGKERKVVKQRVVGYTPNNPEKYTIVILDHIRKMKLERGFSLKQNMDKALEYQVWLRNICRFTFVDIIHLNRNMSDIGRIKHNKQFLYPNNSDLKDSGNLSEEGDFLITLFDANDDRYGIDKHFDLELENYPNYRSIHLVESRDTPCPVHIQTEMMGNVCYFDPI